MGEVVPIAGILAGTLITIATIWGGVQEPMDFAERLLSQRATGVGIPGPQKHG
jgi:hypothetical protein